MPQARLHLDSGLHFTAETGSGFRVEMDSRADDAPQTAATPMELQLVALGGCTAMDVISILRKMRQRVTSYGLHVSGDRAERHPRVYTTVLVNHRLHGHGVADANVRRAIQLSMDRYCSVFNMLYPRVAIREQYEIIDDDTGAVTTGEVFRSDAEAAGSAAG
jgi:putative redox protein